MPSVALNSNTEEKEFAARAKSERRYICPKCKEKVAFVRSHRRGEGETKVRPHFRYNNCGHKGQKTVRVGVGAGGGGSGGENPKHMRRKEDAMDYALNVFPDADYALEKPIGDKQPDAQIIFSEPHEKYGKGLAIEYQNKNESKDRKATEQHFAKHHFTTIWLWDEQFDYDKSPVEVDLYGGEVYTPWPDAVPEQSEWSGLGFAQKQLQRWQRSHDLGIKSVNVPATTIRKWFIPSPKEYWTRNFTAKYSHSVKFFETYLPRWKKRFPDYNGYKSDHYRLQAAIPTNDTSLRVPAKTYHHWHWPTTKEYWDCEPWNKRFNNELLYPQYQHEGVTSVSATIVNKWLLNNKGILHARMGYAWESDKRVAIVCPNCQANLKTDERGKGEIKRGKRCPNCHEWFNVFQETELTP